MRITLVLITLSVAGAMLAGTPAVADPTHRWDLSVGAVSVRPDIDSPVVGADATTEVVPILNVTYFMNNRVALNTAAGITRHKFTANGANLGKASMAPFHLILQYHFNPGGPWRPYAGAGIHHTVFFDQKGPAFDDLRGFPSDTGAVLQAGVSYDFSGRYFMNLDLKKFYLETDVTPQGGSRIETIKLDPLLVGLAVGMRF